LQAVAAVAQLQRRWRSPEAARSGALRFGATALAGALNCGDGALPGGIQGAAKGDFPGGGA